MICLAALTALFKPKPTSSSSSSAPSGASGDGIGGTNRKEMNGSETMKQRWPPHMFEPKSLSPVSSGAPLDPFGGATLANTLTKIRGYKNLMLLLPDLPLVKVWQD